MMQEYKITMGRKRTGTKLAKGQKRTGTKLTPNLPNWQMDDFGTDPRQDKKRNRHQIKKIRKN